MTYAKLIIASIEIVMYVILFASLGLGLTAVVFMTHWFYNYHADAIQLRWTQFLISYRIRIQGGASKWIALRYGVRMARHWKGGV